MRRFTMSMDRFTEYMAEKYKQHTKSSVNDFFLFLTEAAFRPKTPELSREYDIIRSQIEDVNGDKDNIDLLRSCLARAVGALRTHPISQPNIIDQIMIHFRSGISSLRYDYYLVVDDYQDKTLRHLNDILITIDPKYNNGKREFGERSRFIIDHWQELCGYGDTYDALSTIINCEDCYFPIDSYRVLCLLMELDNEIIASPATLVSDSFETNLSVHDKIKGLKYELLVYCGDNGYRFMSGDTNFEQMPSEWNEYTIQVAEKVNSFREYDEEYYNDLVHLEAQARRILQDLYRRRNLKTKQ